MNTASIKELTEKEMLQIKGGESEERWIYIDGVWYLLSGLNL